MSVARKLLPLAFGLAFALALGLGAPPLRATPAACANPCSIQAEVAGFLKPVTEIAAGTTVLWSTAGESHTASESNAADSCFDVAVADGTPVTPVRFDVVGGGVVATVAPGAPGATAKPCTHTTAVSGAGYVVAYQCRLHPWMRGALVVDA